MANTNSKPKNKQIALNKKVPAFNCQCTPEQNIKLSDFKGQKLVICFYPKDNTPGCTTEGQDFQNAYTKFKRADAVNFWSVTRHTAKWRKVKVKQHLDEVLAAAKQL